LAALRPRPAATGPALHLLRLRQPAFERCEFLLCRRLRARTESRGELLGPAESSQSAERLAHFPGVVWLQGCRNGGCIRDRMRTFMKRFLGASLSLLILLSGGCGCG